MERTGHTDTHAFARARRGRVALLAALALLALGVVAGPADAKTRIRPPQTVIQTGPAPRIASRSTTFSYTGTAKRRIRILRFSWKLDRGRWSKFTRASAHTFTNLAPGRHTFRVRAQDGARRTDRSPAVGVFYVDLTPPVVTISGPPNPTPTAINTFSFRSNEPGTTFECSHDGTPFTACRPPIRIGVIANGWHNLLVRGTDVAGNVSKAARRAWKVADTTPPPAPTFPVHPSDGSARSVEFQIADAEAGVRLRCQLDATAARYCTSPVSYANLSIASHTVTVVAVDGVGNVSAPTALTWTVANFDPPDTSIIQKPLAQATDNNATFTFGSSGAHSAVTYECALDTAAFTACTSPQTYAQLPNGDHTFQVRAKDIWGNVDATPATYTWNVNVAPSYKLLIADNEGKRIWITDFNGNPVWKCANPLGDALTYSGPLGVRWLPNNHILATFGTGVVGEIDPSKPCPGFQGAPDYNAANNPFVWKYNGPAGDGFQSPYDADLLPDGKLAVALRFNVITGSPKGKVAVYDRTKTGAAAIVWQLPVPEAHTLTYFPAGTGYNTALPELLVGGFGSDTPGPANADGLQQVVYDPGQADDKTVTWSGPSEYTHRAIVGVDGDVIASEGYYLHEVRRDGSEVWRLKPPRTSNPNLSLEWRGVVDDPTTGGYIAADFTDSRIWFIDHNGNHVRDWGIYKVNDGNTTYPFMKFPYGIRVITYP